MSKIEEMANMCLQELGYITVSTNRELRIGQVVNAVRGLSKSWRSHPVVVMQKTDYEDYCLTARTVGAAVPPCDPNSYYYRVIAE